MEFAQNNIATWPLNEKHCRLCGTPIAGLPFIREGEEYCCEGRFLGRKECRGIEAERDSAYLALAEALAAALDVREHETGLHSKRVRSSIRWRWRHSAPRKKPCARWWR